MERPALQGLLADIRAGRIDILVIYKVDRLTQSLANFARLVEIFDAQDATFVPLRSSSIRRARCGVPHLNFPYANDFIEFIFHPTRYRRPIASLDGSRVE
jgi:hypothetical protein